MSGPYRLVLLDPPYGMQRLDAVMYRIGGEKGLVANGGMVVVGHSRFLNLGPEYGSLRLHSQRRYGDNLVEFFRREREREEDDS